MCCVGAVAASQLDFADLSIFARSFAVLSDGPKIGGVTNVRSKSRGRGAISNTWSIDRPDFASTSAETWRG